MGKLPEKDYHELFRIGMLVKAVDGIVEAAAGIAIYFANYAQVNRVLFSVFREEVSESPHDLIWGYLINEWHHFLLSSHTFWGLLFFIHGLTKLFLAVMLLKNKLWAYPIAAIVFTLFVGYEIYSAINHSSPFLWLISALDAIVVILILHQYHYITKQRTLSG